MFNFFGVSFQFLFIIFCLSSFKAPNDLGGIYVAPNGSDSNTGTISSPLKTLSFAVEKSRKSGVKNIILRGGDYYNTTVTFVPQDANLIIKNYQGEQPVLYGGVLCDNLAKQGKYFVSNVKGTADRVWDFRMIIKDDSMLLPARFPAKGLFSYKNKWNQKTLSSSEGSWQKKPSDTDRDGLQYNESDFRSLDPQNAEIELFHSWNESYLGIKSIDSINKVIYFIYPATYPLGAYMDQSANANKYAVYNVAQGMTSPGSWYLNRSEEKLYYWPLASDNVNKVKIYLPKYRTMFNFGSNGVNNITIDGLTIKGCSSKLQNENFGAVTMDAAISGTNVSNINLSNLSIANTGSSGINLKGNNNKLNNLSLSNLYGGGIYVNGNNNVVSNSKISNAGLLFKSAVGIYEDGAGNSILNINVNNVSYSGICVRGERVTVQGCKVSNVMQYLNDGAAIYCTQRENITITNNVIVGHQGSKIGIYFDEKSNNSTAEKNTIIDFQMPVHCHMANNINFNNNIIIGSSIAQDLSYQNSSNVNFSENIVVGNDIYMDNHHAGTNNPGLGIVDSNYFVTLSQAQPAQKNQFSILNSNQKDNNHKVSLSTTKLRDVINKLKDDPNKYLKLKGILRGNELGIQ